MNAARISILVAMLMQTDDVGSLSEGSICQCSLYIVDTTATTIKIPAAFINAI